MKDPKDTVRDLRNVYDIRFRMQLHANGESEYACSPGILRHVKETCRNAAEVIEYLLKERDSLLDLLEVEGRDADHTG